jgi:hypothetical protein
VARRSALSISLLALAASLVAVPSAHAGLKLPAGADAPPKLPPGVVPASSAPRPLDAGPHSGATASASAARTVFTLHEGPPPLWATVNICDTERSPNALGVRTSVPGDGSGRRVYARYTAQWWSRAKQSWLTVNGAGRTDWNWVGRQGLRPHQAGWTFRFAQPPEGTTYVIRGVVELSWRDRVKSGRKRHRRAGWPVVRRQALLTETGKQSVGGGDPRGTSKAMCLIW